MAAALHIFKLGRPGDDGVPVRTKLEHVEAVTGRRPAELDGPEIPDGCEHLLGWFHDLNTGRGSNGFGLNPLTFAEISAWSSLTGTVIRPAEVRLLKAMDLAYLKANAPEA